MPLVVALIVLLATPRVALGADGAPAAANSAAAYSNFFLSLGGVAFVVVAGAVGALGCVGAVELFASRRARVIP